MFLVNLPALLTDETRVLSKFLWNMTERTQIVGVCCPVCSLDFFRISLDIATTRPELMFTGVGEPEEKLTQQDEEHPRQLGSPVFGHSRLVAHSDAGKNRQQQQDGWQPQNGSSNHEGSTSLHVAWEGENREGALDPARGEGGALTPESHLSGIQHHLPPSGLL